MYNRKSCGPLGKNCSTDSCIDLQNEFLNRNNGFITTLDLQLPKGRGERVCAGGRSSHSARDEHKLLPENTQGRCRQRAFGVLLRSPWCSGLLFLWGHFSEFCSRTLLWLQSHSGYSHGAIFSISHHRLPSMWWQFSNLNAQLSFRSWAPIYNIPLPTGHLHSHVPQVDQAQQSKQRSSSSPCILYLSEIHHPHCPVSSPSHTHRRYLRLFPAFQASHHVIMSMPLLKFSRGCLLSLGWFTKLSLFKAIFLFISSTLFLTNTSLCFKQHFRKIPTSLSSLHTSGCKLSEVEILSLL